MVKILVENRANVDHQNFQGETALHILAHEGIFEHRVYEMMDLLDDANPRLRNNKDKTALDIALENDKTAFIDALFKDV